MKLRTKHSRVIKCSKQCCGCEVYMSPFKRTSASPRLEAMTLEPVNTESVPLSPGLLD
jgi:hypothetical protein